MKKLLITTLALLSAAALQAAPAAKGDPVAPGYPAWTGLTEQNYISGRRLEPSDLRQRVAIVFEFDSAKAHEQLLVASGLGAYYNRLASGHGDGWEHREIHHNTVVLLINRGAKMTNEQFLEAMKSTDKGEAARLAQMQSNFVSVYQGVTFPGAPEADGAYPFYYVMGHEGLEPLGKGKAAGAGFQLVVQPAVNKGIAAMKEAGLEEWKPFYGVVSEPKFFKDLKTLLAKGKPLTAFEAKVKKAVTSSDAAKAKEAQMIYDGLVQTRSDLMTRIELEAAACPHRAAYDAMLLAKYWSGGKKRPGKKGGKAKGGDVDAISQIFIKMMTWEDENFMCKNAGEAKKIVAELNGMKKSIEKLKDSPNSAVQNGAFLLESEIDELIATIPTKVPAK